MCLLGRELQLNGIAGTRGNAYWVSDCDYIREKSHKVVSMYAGTVAMHIGDQNDLFVPGEGVGSDFLSQFAVVGGDYVLSALFVGLLGTRV